jgi:hypothetical protein
MLRHRLFPCFDAVILAASDVPIWRGDKLRNYFKRSVEALDRREICLYPVEALSASLWLNLAVFEKS